MKRYLLFLLAYGTVLTAVMLLTGCASPDALQRVVESALADGAISPAEAEQINAALPASFDWQDALATVGTIAGSLIGVKLLPNSVLRGPWDKPSQPSAS